MIKELASGLVVLMLALPAMAQDFQKGLAAYKKGDYPTALSEFRPLAAGGNAEAQFFLGDIYANGRGVRQNYYEAAVWYQEAADQGHAQAQFSLGSMYQRGLGVTQDLGEALNWYRKAAQQGHVEAKNRLAQVEPRIREPNLTHALKESEKTYGAEHPDVAKHLNNLALFYLSQGRVAEADPLFKRALEINRKALGPNLPNYLRNLKQLAQLANRGSARAQYNLGSMYYRGEGVPEDHGQTVWWWGLAAQQGFMEAQFNLATLYARGLGVPQDRSEAAKWLKKAAEQGSDRAQALLCTYYRRGMGVPQNNAEAKKFCLLAAEKGIADAQYNLVFLTQDPVESMMWAYVAAARGHGAAQALIAISKAETGKRTPEDREQNAKAERMAREWLKKHEAK